MLVGCKSSVQRLGVASEPLWVTSVHQCEGSEVWGLFLPCPDLSLILLQESFSEHLGFTGGIVQG